MTNSPTVEMESPKDESCLSNCTSPTVYTPDSVPTPTNFKPSSLTNSTSHVDERFRRRAISGLLCFFTVGWGEASEYILSFCFLFLIEYFSHWSGYPLHPRGILPWLHSCFRALLDRLCWVSPSYLQPTLGLILPFRYVGATFVIQPLNEYFARFSLNATNRISILRYTLDSSPKLGHSPLLGRCSNLLLFGVLYSASVAIIAATPTFPPVLVAFFIGGIGKSVLIGQLFLANAPPSLIPLPVQPKCMYRSLTL